MDNLIFRDIEKFTKYIPTAIGSDLNELLPFVEEAEVWLQTEVIGKDLYYAIASLNDNPANPVFDGTFDYTFDNTVEPADILKSAERVICLYAYLSAIPFLDVIQTPNGFAVVNNANHAPASKERVERLIRFVESRLTRALDYFIRFAFSYSSFRELWQATPALFNKHTEIVFLTTSELSAAACNNELTFKDLFAIHPAVLLYQTEVANFISKAYMAELIEKRRNATLSADDTRVLDSVKEIVGLKLQKKECFRLLESLVNSMLENPPAFPAYFSSVEYALKIGKKYENKKNDSTFFFG